MIDVGDFDAGTTYLLTGKTIQDIIALAKQKPAKEKDGGDSEGGHNYDDPTIPAIQGTDGQINVHQADGMIFLSFASPQIFDGCRNGLPVQFEIPAREITSTPAPEA